MACGTLLKTKCILSLAVIVSPESHEISDELDALTDRWHAVSEVGAISHSWTSTPSEQDGHLIACVDVSINFSAQDKKRLQHVYNRLSKIAAERVGRLSARTCNLTDLF
ncbi:MAG: hypothetical protein MUC43_16895 [Pirellula sp.]|jgi:hypothetical protein|nr:hypothetical protein [Pirellula sp.]